ncbi:hypothetical protein E2C01_079383 [Portunus trituberculatus]|uniref:Uncharacterized protein n=1 Tax=Portunus trituberculatus TaxID=210409 RepID=A0A5B7IVH1_PORTR|nr:hypothetical protein [Portunus trituberculatus]
MRQEEEEEVERRERGGRLEVGGREGEGRWQGGGEEREREGRRKREEELAWRQRPQPASPSQCYVGFCEGRSCTPINSSPNSVYLKN